MSVGRSVVVVAAGGNRFGIGSWLGTLFMKASGRSRVGERAEGGSRTSTVPRFSGIQRSCVHEHAER